MITTSTHHLAPLEAAQKLVPHIRAEADTIEAERELPRDLADAIADAGLFRMLVPRSLGGGELDPPTHIQVVEEIAKADASVGWCVNQGSVFATHAACMDPDVARQVWGIDPRSAVANGPSPTATAEVVDGGYRVSGSWTFSSGCRHATWLAGVALIRDHGTQRCHPDGSPEARYLLFPKEQAEIVDAWHVRGLRGTGSHHFKVSDLFVPAARSVWSYTDRLHESGPLYLYPMILLFASGFASVALGVARTALEALLELAGAKKPRGAQNVLRDQLLVQMNVGRAEATLGAARAYLHNTVGEVWDAVSATNTMTLEQRVRLRLVTTRAIRQAAEVVDIVYNTSGVDAIYDQHPIQRCFQDIHVITQHIQGRMEHYGSTGQFFLGLEPKQLWM